MTTPTPPRQADISRAESTPTAARSQPSPDPIEAIALVLAVVVTAAAASISTTVELQPPSLETWLEILAGIGLGCGTNLLLACGVRSLPPRAVGALCPLLLLVPFGVPYRLGISASAHALASFIGVWKALDVLAGTRNVAVVSSGFPAFAMHFLSPVEYQIDVKGDRAEGKSGIILRAGPRHLAAQLVETAARYAGLALVASLASYVATLPERLPREALGLYADVWTIYLFSCRCSPAPSPRRSPPPATARSACLTRRCCARRRSPTSGRGDGTSSSTASSDGRSSCR